ncbi:MAG: DNA replication/repair protein RecF [Rhodospirillales bacterium]|nr:DNA replication/repair protein RecF [Rhodospirillales bacterium]
MAAPQPASKEIPTATVAVRSLSLTAFRSWDHVRLDLGREPVVLTGANGAGKTNLLEAVSCLAPGRGLRGAKLQDLARRGATAPWAVAAKVLTANGPIRVGTGADPEGDGNRRVVRIDGEGGRGPSALAEIFSMIWLTPAMDGLFRESSSARRKFFDRLVYAHDPLHARRIGAYERAIRERSRLLKEGRRDPSWLSALEETMAETGIAVAAARRDLADRLAPVLASGLDPFPGAALALDGSLETWIASMPAVDAEQRFRDLLEASRPRDAEAGGAGDGPHRMDLAVTHLPSGMEASLCSTGQQKMLVIALLLAAARLESRRRPPVLLFDDIVAHLDACHRDALVDAVLDFGLQAWMTGTDDDQFSALEGRACFFHIADGKARPRDGQGTQE